MEVTAPSQEIVHQITHFTTTKLNKQDNHVLVGTFCYL